MKGSSVSRIHAQGGVSALSNNGWQPIETAPRDRTVFLTFIPFDEATFADMQVEPSDEDRRLGHQMLWSGEMLEMARRKDTPHHLAPRVTHWRPLPPHPHRHHRSWRGCPCEGGRVMDNNGWRPIATAPRDGTRIMVCLRAGGCPLVTVARWQTDEFAKRPRPFWSSDYWFCNKSNDRGDQPTHWQPLPAPLASPPLPTPTMEKVTR